MRLALSPLSRFRAAQRNYEALSEAAYLDAQARSEAFEALKASVAPGVTFNDWTGALHPFSDAKQTALMKAFVEGNDKEVIRLVRLAFDVCVSRDASDLDERLRAEARS